MRSAHKQKNPTISNVKSLDLWSEWRESNSRPLEPHCASIENTMYDLILSGLSIVKFQIHYIRKMALDGYCLHLDLKELRRMAYLLQMCSNNLNQYAKAANENGRVYAADMEDLRQRLDELIEIGRQILSRLAEL